MLSWIMLEAQKCFVKRAQIITLLDLFEWQRLVSGVVEDYSF